MGMLPTSASSGKNVASQFQPCQIVCLEHEAARLYAEVVQVVEVRQICWARPLMLVVSSPDDETDVESWYDLRDGADLLCPIVLFRAALDVEVMPLLTRLYAQHPGEDRKNGEAFQSLREFLEILWKAHPQSFRG